MTEPKSHFHCWDELRFFQVSNIWDIFYKDLFLSYMYQYACMPVCTMYVSGIQKDEKRASGSMGLELTDGFELPCGCWKLNTSPKSNKCS